MRMAYSPSMLCPIMLIVSLIHTVIRIGLRIVVKFKLNALFVDADEGICLNDITKGDVFVSEPHHIGIRWKSRNNFFEPLKFSYFEWSVGIGRVNDANKNCYAAVENFNGFVRGVGIDKSIIYPVVSIGFAIERMNFISRVEDSGEIIEVGADLLSLLFGKYSIEIDRLMMLDYFHNNELSRERRMSEDNIKHHGFRLSDLWN